MFNLLLLLIVLLLSHSYVPSFIAVRDQSLSAPQRGQSNSSNFKSIGNKNCHPHRLQHLSSSQPVYGPSNRVITVASNTVIKESVRRRKRNFFIAKHLPWKIKSEFYSPSLVEETKKNISATLTFPIKKNQWPISSMFSGGLSPDLLCWLRHWRQSQFQWCTHHQQVTVKLWLKLTNIKLCLKPPFFLGVSAQSLNCWFIAIGSSSAANCSLH